MKKIVLMSFFASALTVSFAGGFTAAKTVTGGFPPKIGGKETSPVIIDSKECQYISEARYNPETKRSEIRLLSKNCAGVFSDAQGWVFDDKMDIGISGKHVKSGTPVTVYELPSKTKE